MKQLSRFCWVFFIFPLFTGCAEKHATRMLDAKVIHYRVEYMDDLAGSIPTNILPNRMTLVFAEKKALNKIEGFLGQFSLSYLADLKNNSVITMLKIFDKQYYYKGKEGEFPAGIVPLEGMYLEATGEDGQIINFDSNKYILHLPGETKYEVFSTPALEIKNPNTATPYRGLPEVLLQFYTELSVLKMLMVAESFEEKKVERNIFTVPDKYIEISRSHMEKLLAELFK